MVRLPVIVAAVLAIAASAPLMCATTSPATARELRDRDGDMDRDLRDVLRDRIRTRQDLRDVLRDRIRTRQDLRDLLEDLFENRPGLRGALRERIREARDEDEDEDEDHEGLRGAIRERIRDYRDRDDEDRGGYRGRFRERLAERIAERRHGEDEGQCFFITRTVRDEDRTLIVRITRRVCRD